MKYKFTYDYDKETGFTVGQLRTSKGLFFGASCQHPDDPFPPSEIMGASIAEARCYINLYNKLIADKKIELKAIKRLLAAMPEGCTNRCYVENLYKAIMSEIEDLKFRKQNEKSIINNTIDGRRIYIKSRSATKEEKERMQKAIVEGFNTLSSTKKDKED